MTNPTSSPAAPAAATKAERNLADSLAELLPDAKLLHEGTGTDPVDQVLHFALPKAFALHTIDNEKLLPNPRRATGIAKLSTAESFVDYVQRHADSNTVVWCNFNPQSYTLGFRAVVDDHANGIPGWREHGAVYVPELSAEWKTWKASDEKQQSQVEFAAFLERNADDINADGGFPSSLDMLRMATEFEANGEKRVKSIVRLQGGGMNLTYVDDNDEATITQMKAFEKFQIGVPVFFDGLGYRLQARLRYRQSQGVKFWYELIRPDRAHETAARALIAQVRGAIGEVPLLMGTFGKDTA